MEMFEDSKYLITLCWSKVWNYEDFYSNNISLYFDKFKYSIRLKNLLYHRQYVIDLLYYHVQYFVKSIVDVENFSPSIYSAYCMFKQKQ